MLRINRAKSIALTLVLVLAALTATAAPTAPPKTMAGSQLVQDMLARPMDDPLNNFRRERAMGYIDGVMDAGLGYQWCPAGRQIPHELNYLITEKLARLPTADLKGNAAVLVLASLTREYPCKPGVKP